MRRHEREFDTPLYDCISSVKGNQKDVEAFLDVAVLKMRRVRRETGNAHTSTHTTDSRV